MTTEEKLISTITNQDNCKATVTREQLVDLIGENKVAELEAVGCEYHSTDSFGDQLYTASIVIGKIIVIANYWMSDSDFVDLSTGEAYEDAGDANWQIKDYTIQFLY